MSQTVPSNVVEEVFAPRKGAAPVFKEAAFVSAKAGVPSTLEEIGGVKSVASVTFTAVVLQVMAAKNIDSQTFKGVMVTAYLSDATCL
jgi:hypothetical protein